MFKKLYPYIITIIAGIFIYLFYSIETDVVYVDSGVLRVDTIKKYFPVPPDTLHHHHFHIREIPVELAVEDNPNQDVENVTFTGNLFEKGVINPTEMQLHDIYKYIVTKPFEAVDSLITKKQDTVVAYFTLSISKPGVFDYYINYSMLESNEIIKTVEAPEHWYDKEWFRYGSLTFAFIIGVYSGLQVNR
jgi:hypothetical protein